MNARLLQLGRFCLVGAAVLVLDFTLIWVFLHVVPRLVAVSIAYVLAVTAHFLLNKWWVFQAGQARAVPQTIRYGLALAACWLSTVSLVWLALHTVTDHVLIAKAIAVPPTTLLGFFLLRFYVFHRPASPGSSQGDARLGSP